MRNLEAESEWLAATAHELRRPLSHIKGFVSSLRRTDVEWDDATRQEFLADIEIETDRLADVVDALLAGRSANGCPANSTRTLTRPTLIVDGGLHRIRGLLQRSPRRIVVDVPNSLPSIHVDASALEAVLANLVENAVKYSPADTPIQISADITQEAMLEVAVEDRGPGVPQEDRERIFEPFVRQASAESSKVSGHGLGLAICQSIVLAHGGSMQVSDRPGGGARFSVFLPVPGLPKRAARLAKKVPTFTHVISKDQRNDSTNDSRRGRRRANAQADRQQSQSQRLSRANRRRWQPGTEADRRVPVRFASA